MQSPSPRDLLRLGAARRAIGMADAGVLALAAIRRRLVRGAAAAKQCGGWPSYDEGRELRVRRRGARVARLLGLPAVTAAGLIDQLIADAWRNQGIAVDMDHGAPFGADGTLLAHSHPTCIEAEPGMSPSHDTITTPAQAWLRLLPPPRRWAPLIRRVPAGLQAQVLERAMGQALAELEPDGGLEVLEGRRVGIEVADLGLHWVVTRRDGVMRACTGVSAPEATVRGSATDLLLLAARLEDADTLFFQRRLVLTGDTELGLTARNLLDRLPWEQVPLALRIGLNRLARLARAARTAAHRHEPRGH